MSRFEKVDGTISQLLRNIIETSWIEDKNDSIKILTNEEVIQLCEFIFNYNVEETLEEIPESIYVPFDVPTNSLNESEQITFFDYHGINLYDGIYAAASRFNYVYRSKGTRIALFRNGDIKVFATYSSIDEHGYNLSNETIDEINIYRCSSDELNDFSSSAYSDYPINSIKFWLLSFANINKRYDKAYYLEYLLTPPDVLTLSNFSIDIRNSLWEFINLLAQEIIYNNEVEEKLSLFQYILNLVHSLNIEGYSNHMYKLFRFILNNKNRVNFSRLEVVIDKLEKLDLKTSSVDSIVSELIELKKEILSTKKHLVITEGKTDWKHLKRALLKFRQEDLFLEDDFEFLEYEDQFNMGDKDLISLCEQACKLNNEYKIICIFDRDVPTTLTKVQDKEASYKYWGNNVYSFAIPVPTHRTCTPEISIEHYYTDAEIKTENQCGKRLYLGNEFSRKSGINKSGDRFCLKKDKCGKDSIRILDRDCEVYLNIDEKTNIALSKSEFSQSILDGVSSFDKIGYKSFVFIFDIIREIISDNGISYVRSH